MCEVKIIRKGRKPPPMMPVAERNELIERVFILIRKLSRRFRDTPIYDFEDVAQEAALTAILRSGSYANLKGSVAPSSWVFNIVRQTVRDHCERYERRSSGVMSYDQHEEIAELLSSDRFDGE